MANSFGTTFRMTTWGESHGPAIGCVIDGCPPGIVICEKQINEALIERAPGRSAFVSERKEPDTVRILSGTFESKSTGAPLCLLIENRDADSSKYEPIKDLFRPGHANYTYLKKYGIFDWRGGGRASARETAARVAAGVVAQGILDLVGIRVLTFLQEVAAIEAKKIADEDLETALQQSAIFCPDPEAERQMIAQIMQAKQEGDSVGGVVQCEATGVPAGLGEPLYDKITARLAYAMMGLPASRGFEIGEGFSAAVMRGSEHNDPFEVRDATVRLASNHAGGVLGGITTGEKLWFRVAFKPTSSIQKEQKSATEDGREAAFSLPEGSRHDPCVAIRAVPVVKAMCRIVLVDALLSQQFPLEQKSNTIGRIAYGGRIGRWQI